MNLQKVMTRFGVYLALVCLKTVIAFNLVSWSKSLAMNGRNVALQPFKHAKKLPLNMVQYSVDDGILAQMVEDRDACGVGFIASLDQKKTHSILKQALNALGCMEHRGATSADNVSGDGAGVSTDIPWKLFDKVDLDKVTNIDGSIASAVAQIFLPDGEELSRAMQFVENVAKKSGLDIVQWRDVPVNENVLGELSREFVPTVKQVVFQLSTELAAKTANRDEFELILYDARREIQGHFRSRTPSMRIFAP